MNPITILKVYKCQCLTYYEIPFLLIVQGCIIRYISHFTLFCRLIELSKEQKIEICRLCTLDNIVDNNQSSSDRQLRNVDGLSIKSTTSEANNLVEEVIMKNACSDEITASVENTSGSLRTILGSCVHT